MRQCIVSRKFACSSEAAETAEDIGDGSLVFLFNAEANRLIGPFTAVAVLEDSEDSLEEGAWVEETDEETFSENFKVEWESLHDLEDAGEKFPFLNDAKNCKLDQLQTHEVLTALKDAPEYKQQ